jgi:hypothetical protein
MPIASANTPSTRNQSGHRFAINATMPRLIIANASEQKGKAKGVARSQIKKQPESLIKAVLGVALRGSFATR